MLFKDNKDILYMIIDEDLQKSINLLKKLEVSITEAKEEVQVWSVENLEKDRKKVELLRRIYEKFNTNNFLIDDQEELEAIAEHIHFWLLDVEEETIEQIKEDCISDAEIDEVKQLYAEMSQVIINMNLKHYQSNLKPRPDLFIEKINYMREKDNIDMKLKKSEIEALQGIFNHIRDHDTWMYDAFNSMAISGLSDKVNRLIDSGAQINVEN